MEFLVPAHFSQLFSIRRFHGRTHSSFFFSLFRLLLTIRLYISFFPLTSVHICVCVYLYRFSTQGVVNAKPIKTTLKRSVSFFFLSIYFGASLLKKQRCFLVFSLSDMSAEVCVLFFHWTSRGSLLNIAGTSFFFDSQRGISATTSRFAVRCFSCVRGHFVHRWIPSLCVRVFLRFLDFACLNVVSFCTQQQ